MRLGILSDVHGNRIALEAVLADGRARGVDAWWALGDLVAMGPDPVGSAELLAGTPGLVAIRGNTERYVLTRRPAAAARGRRAGRSVAARDAGRRSRRRSRGPGARSPPGATSAGWPPCRSRCGWSSTTAPASSASTPRPGRDDGDGISPDRPEAELAAALAGADADVVVAGHTHRPTDRTVGAIRAVNPGSVSNPVTDDVRAGYVIVHADRSGHRVEHRRVDYDREAFLDRLRESGCPAHDFLAAMFRRGG